MEQGPIKITEAHYISGYSIDMTFSDSSKQTIDFEPFLLKSTIPNINKYLDKGKFKRFSIIDGNLNWKNYDLTFPVENLYAGKI